MAIEDRLAHIQEAKRTFQGVTMPWLCDNMSSDLEKALGSANNSEFIFDPDGKIVHLRDWSSPTQLRADLQKLVGPVTNPTSVADLKLSDKVPAPAAARGIVPRIEVPEDLQSIKVTPKALAKDKPANPYYSKLQAKADDELLKTGKGKLYLSFHLDPVYKVHWNNLVAPIEYEIKTEKDTRVSPESGKGPIVKAAADIDPREFLLNIQGGDSAKPLELTVRYFACNDDEGWCKLVTQSYLIHLEADAGRGGRDRPFDARRRPGPGGPPGEGGLPQGGFSVERLFRFDSNDDGKISKDELPEFLRERILDRIDTNKDGMIDKKEAANHFK